MIVIKQSGNFDKTEKFLKNASRRKARRILEKYAQKGVAALADATPKDSGKTAASWGYDIWVGKNGYTVSFTNDNVNDGVPIAIILQYGHATGTGGYVQGRDYINPAIQPIFDKIANEAWKEVTKV